MHSREPRFWLRFESGAREGERLPLPEAVHTLGRRSENTIVVTHGSVSGRHAELRVEAGRVTVVDTGSTNGTRVGGEKIESRELAHGDTVHFGTVKAVLEDAQLLGAAPTAAPLATETDEVVLEGDLDTATSTAAAPGAALDRVSADTVARAGRGSKLGLVLIVLLVASGAFLVWRLLPRGGETALASTVEPIPGNLLDDASFEDAEAPPWSSADAAPQGFFVDGAYARSGTAGLGVVLAEGEWAYARSPEFRLPPRRSVELSTFLAVSGGAVGRVGLELSTSEEVPRSFVAWAPSLDEADCEGGFVQAGLAIDVLPGYAAGRVVVAARTDGGEGGGEGDVSLDDVGVVLGDRPLGATASFEEYELFVLGSPGSTAALVRSGRVLFHSIALSSWMPTGLEGWSDAAWTARSTDTGFELESGPAPAGARCDVRVFGNRGLSAADDVAPWMSTIGPDGYRAHALTFEREGVESLLVGGGVNLIRFGLEAPETAASSVRDENAHIRLGFGGASRLELQLGFREERSAATRLANRARQAEAAGEAGAAILAWSELLDRYPYERAMIAEAEESRARLAQAGLEEVEDVRREIDRADFFQLADLYRQGRARAAETAARYAGSAAETAANELIARIDEAVRRQSLGHAGSRAERLQGVLEALDGARQPGLTAHVRNELEALGGTGSEAGD
jgi:hypothetical protein